MKTKRYTVTKSLRFTPEEWADIESKLGGRKWSATVRALLFNTPLPSPPKAIRRRPMNAKEAKMTLILAGMANNLSHETQRQHTMDFLTTLLPGLTPGEDYAFVVVAHREHPKRLGPVVDATGQPKFDQRDRPRKRKIADLSQPPRSGTHLIVANVHIPTGRRLQPY